MSNIENRIKKVNNFLKELPRKFHEEFKSKTPIDTGNARRNTDLRRNEIVADYEYAGKLQAGKSKQAPDGMRDPTIDEMRKNFKNL